jgi:hypothetical protein
MPRGNRVRNFRWVWTMLPVMVLLASCAPDLVSPIEKIIETDSELTSLTTGFPVPILVAQVPGPTGTVSYSTVGEADRGRLVTYLKLFSEEFRKYPVGLIQAAGLQGVAVVKDLTVSGQLRPGVADTSRKILFLDLAFGAYDSTYQRHVIHHEFFHMLEPSRDWNGSWQDPAWAALNEPGFQYGNGGGTMQNSSGSYYLTHPQPGFTNLYSTSGLEEDKAEIFTALFMAGEYEKVMDWAQTDEILANKINAMKNYLQQKCPEIDEAFWTRLHPGN